MDEFEMKRAAIQRGNALGFLREIRDLLHDRLPESLRCAACARPMDPLHKDACELNDNAGWVCSEKCWEDFAAKLDPVPAPAPAADAERGEAALCACGNDRGRVIDGKCAACRADAESPAPCVWTEDRDSGAWGTSCGNKFTFIDDGPVENRTRFCCYCGKPVEANHEDGTPEIPEWVKKTLPPAPCPDCGGALEEWPLDNGLQAWCARCHRAHPKPTPAPPAGGEGHTLGRAHFETEEDFDEYALEIAGLRETLKERFDILNAIEEVLGGPADHEQLPFVVAALREDRANWRLAAEEQGGLATKLQRQIALLKDAHAPNQATLDALLALTGAGHYGEIAGKFERLVRELRVDEMAAVCEMLGLDVQSGLTAVGEVIANPKAAESRVEALERERDGTFDAPTLAQITKVQIARADAVVAERDALIVERDVANEASVGFSAQVEALEAALQAFPVFRGIGVPLVPDDVNVEHVEEWICAVRDWLVKRTVALAGAAEKPEVPDGE